MVGVEDWFEQRSRALVSCGPGMIFYSLFQEGIGRVLAKGRTGVGQTRLTIQDTPYTGFQWLLDISISIFIPTALEWSLSLLQHFQLQPAPCAWGEKAGNRAISAIRRDSTLSKFLIGGQALESG